MKIGVIGRTSLLLETVKALINCGHQIVFIYTCRAESFYDTTAEDFQIIAESLKCPFFNDTKIEDNAEYLAGLGAEVCISVNWLTVLKSPILNSFPFGVLNAHAGDLPRYRGNACPNWAIINNEKKIALTIHKMEEELDAGPYLLKKYYEMNDDTYIGDIYSWLDQTVPEAFVEALKLLKTQPFIEQSTDIVPLRTFPRRAEDALIDWRMSSQQIYAVIRASAHPFPGAFCFLDLPREKIRILSAKPFKVEYDFLAIPGHVCIEHKGNPVIATGCGMLELTRVVFDSDGRDARSQILSSLRNRLVS